MSKDIVIDDYLINLKSEINNDKDIKSLADEYQKSNIDQYYLREQLAFFKNFNIDLHKIVVLDDDVKRTLSPEFLRVELNNDDNSMDKIGTRTHGIYDTNEKEPWYKVITINNYNNYYPRIAYIHEITHTQVNDFINSNDEYNRDVMPIFMELLYSDTIRYKNRVNDRLYYWSSHISNVDKDDSFEDKSYIKSLLQALKLYRLYNKSGMDVKLEMQYYIKLLFNRDIYLDDLLNIYEINYENSKSELNVLKRSK